VKFVLERLTSLVNKYAEHFFKDSGFNFSETNQHREKSFRQKALRFVDRVLENCQEYQNVIQFTLFHTRNIIKLAKSFKKDVPPGIEELRNKFEQENNDKNAEGDLLDDT